METLFMFALIGVLGLLSAQLLDFVLDAAARAPLARAKPDASATHRGNPVARTAHPVDKPYDRAA
jgi:hypothetical protein